MLTTAIDFTKFEYSVPEEWYKNVYKDKKECCSAARSFSLKHEKQSKECWLLIHGYRGYPGEMVRPAYDLFEAGFDVFVPRLPGCGTCGDDFIKSRAKDWMQTSEKALNDLQKRYEKVNLVGHSMGCAICAILGCNNPKVGKIVYGSPSFDNLQMPLHIRLFLAVISPFIKRIKTPWHSDNSFHLHYENAPCDDSFLGEEYFQYYFPKQLIGYWRIMKKGMKEISKEKTLFLYPLHDKAISGISMKRIKQKLGNEIKVVEIPTGTHLIFYDRDVEAEEKAVQSILDFCSNS